MPLSYEDLERRFDGPIPPALLQTKTEDQLQIDHHRAMIRFSEGRIKDFAASLERLLGMTDAQQPGREAWIDRTRQIIAEHRADIDRHNYAIAELMGEAQLPAAAE